MEQDDENEKERWGEVLEGLRGRVGEQAWEEWLRPIGCEELGTGRVVLWVSDEFARAWIEDHYLQAIQACWRACHGPASLELAVGGAGAPRGRAAQHQLPFALGDGLRASPNCVGRSALFGVVRKGPRPVLENTPLESWADTEIFYSGERLDQGDHDVWMQLLHLHRGQPLGQRVVFVGREFLQGIGRSTGGNDFAWLNRSLRRMWRAGFKIIKTCPHSGERRILATSLIGSFGVDEASGHYYVQLDLDTLALFEDGYTHVAWGVRAQLRGQLTRWLQVYVGTHRGEHAVGLERLRALCNSGTSDLRKFRYQVRQAMPQLEELGEVARWEITPYDALYFARPSRRQAA